MAHIKKDGARKRLEEHESATPAVKYDSVTNGLLFEVHIGSHRVSLTHVERDRIVESWQQLEREWQQ